MDEQHDRAQTLDKIFFVVVSGLCAGIIFAAFVAVQGWVFVVIGVGAMGAAFGGAKRRAFVFISIFLFASLVGIARMDMAKPDIAGFTGMVGEKVIVHGIIDDPENRANGGAQFTLQSGGVNILVSAKNSVPLSYGDEVEATGTLTLPQNFLTDQGTVFDYVSYLYKDDILYQMRNVSVTVLSHGNGNWLVAHLIPVKDAIVQSFNRILPPPQASLLAGLNLGEKENIDPAFRDDLVATGTIHIIALSGYNVTIVANALRDLFVDILGLSMRIAAVAGALCIILFVVMTGLQSSAIRAGIMALIALFGRGSGRTYDAFRALVLAGFAMILYDPKYLVYDVSFQLSFLATLGIIFITPVLERAFARVPKKLFHVIPLREAMAVTLGAQFSVLPFILYKMGTLSLIALPANIFVLPAVPFAMGFGALAGLIGTFSTGLAYPVTFVTSLLLDYITGTVSFFARVPYASLVIDHFPVALCLSLYGILLYWVHGMWKKEKAV